MKFVKESQTLRLHIHQDHENRSDNEGHEMEITGNNVNHEGEDEDNFEEESVVNNDVEAFKDLQEPHYLHLSMKH